MKSLAEGNKLSLGQGHGFFLGKADDSAQEEEHINRKAQSGREWHIYALGIDCKQSNLYQSMDGSYFRCWISCLLERTLPG